MGIHYETSRQICALGRNKGNIVITWGYLKPPVHYEVPGFRWTIVDFIFVIYKQSQS